MGHREELLAGAKRAIYEKGYWNATARDIVALSGTNLGSIGYHYGSTQALLTAAMISSMQDWGEELSEALTAPAPGDPADPMLRFWRRVIGSITAHRRLWLASVEAMTAAEHNADLRTLLAGAVEEGRRGMAAIVTGVPEDQLDEATVRTVGAMQMALMSGVVTQWLTDPASAPSAEEIVAGVRGLVSGLSQPTTTPSPA
jgi:AcrR family transcriptional regulator